VRPGAGVAALRAMDVGSWLFGGWTMVLRTIVVGVGAYAALVVVLRTSGKRTLSKLNAFDLIVTVALGSTLASVLVSPTTSVAQGAAAFVTLVLLQGAITWSSARWPRAARLARAEPTLLVHDGRVLPGVMRGQRVTEGEVLSAIRSAGLASVEDALAVVLDGNGTLAVVGRAPRGTPTALADVPGAAPPG